MKTVFQIVLGGILLVIVGMVYWSSLLVEEDLKAMKRELLDVKKELKVFKDSPIPEMPNSSGHRVSKIQRPFINKKLPNLLVEDPYYKTTLVTLLGDHFQPKGVRKEAILGKPDHLHPFNNFHEFAQMILNCTGTLGQLHFGKYETFSPYFALKIEKRARKDIPEAFEYWIHLRDDLFWEKLDQRHFPEDLVLSTHFLERHPVTAYDFKFYYDAIMNPYVGEPKAGALRKALSDIESFDVIDPLTFVVRWRAEKVENHYQVKYTSFGLTCSLQPLPCFVYQYFADGKKIIDDDSAPDTYQKNSIWAQNFSNHFAKNVIVSSGAYLFAGMNDEGIKFRRNPHFYDPYAVLVEEYHIAFKESVDAIWQDFKAQKIDLCTLSPNQFLDYTSFLNTPQYREQKNRGSKINQIEFVDRSYFYLGWNEKKPYFQSKLIRQALTHAIDRRRIIEQNLNHMGVLITGPFFPYSPSYDATISPLVYNPDETIYLLEEDGWFDKDGDGVREKTINGETIPFRFTLIYYVKNMSTKVICEYVSTALREVGIDCRLHGVDLPDLSRDFEDKAFDAIFLGWGLGTPPEDPEQLWHSQLAELKGSSNAIGFSNHDADAIIERLHYEYNSDKRLSLYHRFHKIIFDEAPYTFLYSPKRRLIYRDYVKNLIIPKDNLREAEVAEPEFRAMYIDDRT